MITILAHHRVDHDLITGQALLNDSWRQRGRDHTLFLARLAGALLALADHYEVLRRLHIQLATLLVADQDRFFAAALADTLLGRALQDPLYTRKRCGQFLPSRMLALRFRRGLDRRALALRCTSTVLTPGSSSSNSSCASESFSLPGPYFAMRTSRNRSSSTWIFSSAYCSLF